MWRITLFINVVTMLLAWLLCLAIIEPVYNNLIRYGEGQVVLPMLTETAVSLRFAMGLLPLVWAVATVVYARFLAVQEQQRRNEAVSLHTALSCCLGLGLVLFFVLSALLPFLLIGASVGQ